MQLQQQKLFLIFFLSLSCNLYSQQALKIPEIITPNGDGFNDVLVIDSLENFPDNELLIFTRGETEVYRSYNYQNNWDGSWLQTSEPLAPGTYYYVLILNRGKADEKIFKGSLNIKR